MSLFFQDALACLGRLSAVKLDKTSRRIRKNLADAEWKMGLCLLAMVRSGGFRELGYATISEYAEKVLNLSGKKLSWLLNTAKALEHLPLLSQAFKQGEIGWGKVRALQSLATPETEREWLDFALENNTDAVSRKVAMSPTQWKRHRALEASLRKEPVVDAEAVKSVLSGVVSTLEVVAGRRDSTDLPLGNAELSGVAMLSTLDEQAAMEMKTAVTVSDSESSFAPVVEDVSGVGGLDHGSSDVGLDRSLPAAGNSPAIHKPCKIRLTIEFTPDQYALYEAAERRVRAQSGKRLPRAEVVTRMAEKTLDEGAARSRLRHQVLIHTCESCRSAWYETEKGIHPVSGEVLQEALGKSRPLRLELLEESFGPGGGADEKGMAPLTKGWADEKDAADFCFTRVRQDSESIETGVAVAEASGEEASLGGVTKSKGELPERPSSRAGWTGRPPFPTAENSQSRNPLRDLVGEVSLSSRDYIPNATLRALFARAGNRCERCRAKSCHLEVHHVIPVSEGGGHSLEQLRLYCRACHSLHHQSDLVEKPGWRFAKQKAIADAERRRNSDSGASFQRGKGEELLSELEAEKVSP